MAKKKILIISYYYPPSNCIAGLRPQSFANYLSDYYEIKVITRQWDGTEKQWKDYLKSNKAEKKIIQQNDNLEITYVPYTDARKKKNKLRTLFDLVKGKLDYDYDCNQLKSTAVDIVETWGPELLLVSLPPNNLINLAYSLNKKYKLPYIVDFRDFENEVLLNNQTVSLKSKFIHFFTHKNILKKVKNSILVVTINSVFYDYIKDKGHTKVLKIYNGYENSIFYNFKNRIKNKHLTLSITGTIYPQQEISTILNGFDQFLDKNLESRIIINFMGIETFDSVPKFIKNNYRNPKINIIAKQPRDEAINLLENSDILFYMGWKGYKGVYSGKIFEYLGAKRNILIAPSDEDVIEELLRETNGGEVANTPEEVCAYLERKYAEWKAKGYIDYHGNDEKIAFYSRENQASILQKEIEKILF